MWCAHTAKERNPIAGRAKNGRETMWTSGWPKNHDRCCQSIPPPFSRLKTSEPRCRSDSSAKKAAVSGGNATRMRMLVVKIPQQKIGIRKRAIPGARRHTRVVRPIVL
jgi:hypothetical protein